ncbi:MAG: HEAT repeat domain-containing protein [Anaerolineales bacterium]|nr:HEAT repeat domain-containing protein [Anaerolineales bacterium]
MSWMPGRNKSTRAKQLILLLSDSDPHKQHKAAEELRTLGTDAVVPLVDQLAEKDIGRNKIITQILTKIGPAGIPAFKEAMNGKHPLVQAQVISILGQFDHPDIVPVLVQSARSEFFTVRSRAAIALGNTANPQVIPVIQNLLSDPEPDVRGPAVLALGRFSREQDLELIADLLLEDTDLRVRQAAARALGMTRLAKAAPYLVQAMRDSAWWIGASPIGLVLIQALEQIGKPAVDELIEALKFPEVVIRRCAVDALGRIGDPLALESLQMALYDVHYDVGHAAAQALASFGQPALNILVEALRHPEAWIRQQSITGLEKIGDRSAAPAILALVNDEDRAVQLQAIRTLGILGDRQALPILNSLSENRQERELSQAARQARDSIQQKNR